MRNVTSEKVHKLSQWYTKFEGKTLARIRHLYFALTEEIWVSLVSYYEKIDRDISENDILVPFEWTVVVTIYMFYYSICILG